MWYVWALANILRGLASTMRSMGLNTGTCKAQKNRYMCINAERPNADNKPSCASLSKRDRKPVFPHARRDEE